MPGQGQVSLLAALGLAAGALLAIPLGPWVEFRRKRPVMIAMDLVRFAAQITVPVAYVLGWLTFVQLLLVTVVVAGAKIAFQAAGGAHLKALVEPDDLLVANARFESTTWSSLDRRDHRSAVPRSASSERSRASPRTPSATCCLRSGSA